MYRIPLSSPMYDGGARNTSVCLPSSADHLSDFICNRVQRTSVPRRRSLPVAANASHPGRNCAGNDAAFPSEMRSDEDSSHLPGSVIVSPYGLGSFLTIMTDPRDDAQLTTHAMSVSEPCRRVE